ncbi:MAG: P1 family peptidase [Clostridia bacterium]|nr:P1 family peptidase [Clostridia bacterium]
MLNGNGQLREIRITDLPGIRIGQAENREAGTGCTVLIAENGVPAGLDVRGGGPASRESELLKPLAAAECIHAILLSGGSAYGLDAAGGVMQYLEERHIGFKIGGGVVPLVCQSDLFDLTVGDWNIRPDRAMGYAACVASESGNYRDGNYGAGTGATIGKALGMEYCMKSGIGSYAVEVGGLMVGALVAVNALGDVYDWKNGQIVAGQLDETRKGLRPVADFMYSHYATQMPQGNTTIGVVLTNAGLGKTALCKVAGLAHNGYARAIRPVHTSADGDSIYAMSLGNVPADSDLVGTLAADVMAEAILQAVYAAESAYGYPAWRDLKGK